MTRTKSILVKVAIGIGTLIAILLIYAATKPDTFSVERSIVINASPETLHAIVNDFRVWEEWSPWAKMDPAMKATYTGPMSGVGSVYEWSGNSDVGSGRMEITGSVPPSKVTIKLDFITPFEASNITEFTFTPQGSGTKVTWLMFGPSNYMSKLMTVFMDMDSMIGKDFENGLNNIKKLAEK